VGRGSLNDVDHADGRQEVEIGRLDPQPASALDGAGPSAGEIGQVGGGRHGRACRLVIPRYMKQRHIFSSRP
jgi:hypothetical protein